ncbi:hypothetical protein [Psychromonas sp. Urea-02u-13]|uniref:hypothetical protein n=1 Tax=Psychromonas sp. Urea-02u-13 TaxID=2058326 RepID=UPI000C32FC1E|nr:hypothetical protein [Psychromonas sp. Urea-02u-13]PKG37025.1 hypothetical protein CXF74_21035 [Psychromonas sp. Urea-02u-13]
MQVSKKIVLFGLCFFSISSFACGGFGNQGDGCADKVLGVQTEAGTAIEITTAGTSWYKGHVCEGSTVVQFSGTDLEKKSALSIAMASYMSNKGPIFFRCSVKLSSGVCGCTNVALGNVWRD